MSAIITNESGSTSTLSGTCSITADGIVSTSMGDTQKRCVMDLDKSIVVCTYTTTGGNSGMAILTKKAASYSQEDLSGTWEMNGFTPTTTWWERGTAAIDSVGSFSSTVDVSDGSTAQYSGQMSTASDGIINVTGTENQSYVCAMDAGKTAIICTGLTESRTKTIVVIFTKKAVPYVP
jgi:hypothetical protein